MINKQAFFRIWQKLFGTTMKKAEMFAERAVMSPRVGRNVVANDVYNLGIFP